MPIHRWPTSVPDHAFAHLLQALPVVDAGRASLVLDVSVWSDESVEPGEGRLRCSALGGLLGGAGGLGVSER